MKPFRHDHFHRSSIETTEALCRRVQSIFFHLPVIIISRVDGSLLFNRRDVGVTSIQAPASKPNNIYIYIHP